LAKNDSILFKGAYGLASKRFNVPNRIDTKFNLGSMNKMFTGVAVAQLVEKGKLSYEDLAGKYLDSTWIQKETAEKVKIKHLLTHTSGLGSFFNDTYEKTSRLLLREIDDWKPLVKDDKPKFEPGSRWSYSNTGMFLLGVIIEKASGMGYYDYIREHISKPAGMINSDCYEMDRPVPNLAIGYYKKYTENGFDWYNNIFLHTVKGGPAGGGFSTVEDLFRFARALMGNQLVSKESVELLTTSKPHLNSPDYGYGFGISKIGDETIVGHSGGFSGINSTLQIYKKSGYIYAIMSNYSYGTFFISKKLERMLEPRGEG
jgi:CubicO group peptidase (beta-lactamase class C family)